MDQGPDLQIRERSQAVIENLQKDYHLPPRDYIVPGDSVGIKYIAITNKLGGIEEGFAGFRRDNIVYQEFIENKIKSFDELLKKPNDPLHNDPLFKRYCLLINSGKITEGSGTQKKIDCLLDDNQHEPKKYSGFRNFLKKINYYNFSDYPQDFQNGGAGGLIYRSFLKEKYDVDPDAPPTWDTINKVKKVVGKAYLAKQYSKLKGDSTGMNADRIANTSTMKAWPQPFRFLISQIWAARYPQTHDISDLNISALTETLATKMASIQGVPSQGIEVEEGTFANGQPQMVVVCEIGDDVEGMDNLLVGLQRHILGKPQDLSGVLCNWDKNRQPIKIDQDGNIIRVSKIIKNKWLPNTIEYEKVGKDGKITILKSSKEYDKAKPISNNTIKGLDESLTTFLIMGDRDGIGKNSNNKMIRKLKAPEGNYQYELYGIDYGKAYPQKNLILDSLQDDFSFDNPTHKAQKCFSNYSALYDNTLRSKMKGMYLHAALKGNLPNKEEVAKQYEASGDPADKAFAQKLRDHPKIAEIAEQYKNSDNLENREFGKFIESQLKNRIEIPNIDLNILMYEMSKYRNGARSLSGMKKALEYQRDFEKDPTKRLEIEKEIDNLDKKIIEYDNYAEEIVNLIERIKKSDERIQDIFGQRLKLMPNEIEVLDNLEKLTADKAHIMSIDGSVILNHLRVEKQDRIPWQFNVTVEGESRKINLSCQANGEELSKALQRLQEYAKRNKNGGGVIIEQLLRRRVQNDKGMTISNITPEELRELSLITEDRIAKHRSSKEPALAQYRSESERNKFQKRLDNGEKQTITPKQVKDALPKPASKRPVVTKPPTSVVPQYRADTLSTLAKPNVEERVNVLDFNGFIKYLESTFGIKSTKEPMLDLLSNEGEIIPKDKVQTIVVADKTEVTIYMDKDGKIQIHDAYKLTEGSNSKLSKIISNFNKNVENSIEQTQTQAPSSRPSSPSKNK